MPFQLSFPCLFLPANESYRIFVRGATSNNRTRYRIHIQVLLGTSYLEKIHTSPCTLVCYSSFIWEGELSQHFTGNTPASIMHATQHIYNPYSHIGFAATSDMFVVFRTHSMHFPLCSPLAFAAHVKLGCSLFVRIHLLQKQKSSAPERAIGTIMSRERHSSWPLLLNG